ncbi:MAG: hypothetical protein SOZ81_11765 [Agathobacter sp.]|nr:hypothetical protein [Agathobacter sp.]
MANINETEENVDNKELSKKELKALKKKEKKEKKEKAKSESGLEGYEEEEETIGSKLMIFFVTLLIIVIWLGIIAILIKSDFGGFGSTVLAPMLKNVPYVNKILPESEVVVNTENTEYPYDSIEEAVEKIKELEIELDNATSSGSTDAQTIAELQAQIEELMVYKQEQADFEKEKEKYYEEVVFSDKAPDINEYKTYYESIDPENAEVLYKRVIEQIEEDQKIKDYAATYSTMKPKEAAAIFDTMTGDLKLVAKILMAMDTESRASILGKMNTDTAAKLTQMMKP